MSRLIARVHRLEHGRDTAEHQPRHYVLRLGHEGQLLDPEPAYRAGDTVVYLPVKAKSVEAWVASVTAAGVPRPQKGDAP
jgi:hypothetical protein